MSIGVSKPTKAIDRDTFRRVERELYNYQANIRTLNEKRGSILHGSPYRFEGRSEGRLSDPTSIRGGRLADLNNSEQAKWVQCIHDALQIMPTEYKTLVKLKYFDQLRTDTIARRLKVGRTLYFSWRENVVLYIAILATQRGLMQPIKERAEVKNTDV